MDHEAGIGARIARNRKRRGLTQTRFAELVPASVSLVRQVESGHKPASPAFTAAAARALGVPVHELQGQPYRGENLRGDALHACVTPLRRSLLAWDMPADAPPRPLNELRTEVRNASSLHLASDYRALGEILPALLEEMTVTFHSASGGERKEAAKLLAEAYRAALEIVYKLGYGDLVLTALDRLRWAAEESGDPLLAKGVTGWLRGWILCVNNDEARALKLLEDSRRDLEPLLDTESPQALSVIGSLHLRQAIVLSRQGKLSDADVHIARARELADRLGVDGNAYLLAFGPTNVAIHSVAVAVDAQCGDKAIERARHLGVPRTLSKERASHHLIDVARAYQQEGQSESALSCLQKARRLAPQHTRLHPMVHETVRSLIIDQRKRRAVHPVVDFADWLRLTV